MSDIKFECPNCHRHMTGPAELQKTFVDCPECRQNFKPCPRPDPAVISPDAAAKWERHLVSDRVDKIRRTASVFSAIGVFFVVIGFLFGIGAILAKFAAESGAENFTWFIYSTGIGLGFYVIGQIVHIRANTEK